MAVQCSDAVIGSSSHLFLNPYPHLDLFSSIDEREYDDTPPLPLMALRHYLSMQRRRSALFPSASKRPRRFSPSIAQEAISARSFGHDPFQPRAKKGPGCNRGGEGGTTERNPINPYELHNTLDKVQARWLGCISLRFTHRNSLKIHSTVQPSTQSARRTQPHVSDWTLTSPSEKSRPLGTYPPSEAFIPNVTPACGSSSMEARHIHISTHPSTPIHNKPKGYVTRHTYRTCAERTRGKAATAPPATLPRRPRRRPKSCELRNWVVERCDWCVGTYCMPFFVG
ncbi:hypothetical protein B0T18DRAFT_32392 [Schizothecium vesticola]|uniref:Uncharacterized protein n=1 Tax=Schizothecium vesticola TaxID=314040 RepID=A0AA40FBE2_9PEZI|nr:hypothetical protein B0T18DRAFT_32392 [Schizothecium vesticola]